MEKILNEVKALLKTLLCFSIACLLLPLLLLSLVCVHYGNELVNYVLSIKYPTLTISKSKKIRTLIDTSRNAGIFHFLLQVKGTCDFDKIKQHYTEQLTDIRDKTGLLRFPKLRQKLVPCWGHYAWVNDNSSFNINNHILLSSRTFRGRLVNDGNIQEFVSDLVTKYIPSDLPQWQVIVIPTSFGASESAHDGALEDVAAEHYYILIKIHHLIIAEEEDLHISEMLMLQENNGRQVIDMDALSNAQPKPKNLSYFVRKPVHIQHLLQHVWKLVETHWNAFIYEFESLETPDGYRRVQINNITQLLSVFLIIAVNVCIAYWRTMQDRKKRLRRSHKPNKENGDGMIATFTRLLSKEIDQRNLSWLVACDAVRSSWHPTNLAKTWTKFMWEMNVNHFLMFPYKVYRELMAMRDLLFSGQTSLTSTYCGRLSVYLPMLIYAQMEFFKICYELFKAPVNIYEELFEHPSKESNILQMKSYSGRKIVSFTKSIDATQMRKRNNFSNEVHESDFTLTCLAGAIHDYFESYAASAPVPKMLNTTCRTIGKGYFTDNLSDKIDHIGGVVFLQLPLRAPDREHARQMHAIVENIRRKQIMIYLASMGQTKFDMLTALVPRVLTKIFINFFSFNFPVTITEIHGATSEFQTLWGQQVQDVLLFRPPQSKTCLSLNIHRFGDKYRLAIMADTQLGPDHSKIAHSFEDYMENLTL